MTNLLRSASAGMAIALTIATVTVWPASADPTPPPRTIYVACGKSKHGSGTSTDPLSSLTQLDDLAPFHPGEKIVFKRNTRCTGQFFAKGSGTSKAPITLGAYGSGPAPLLAGGGTPSGTGVINITDQHDWVVQDLHITNRRKSRSTAAYRAGVLMINNGSGMLSGIVVQRLFIENVASNMSDAGDSSRDFGGIVALTTETHDQNGFDGLQIRNNTLSHVGRSGIMVSHRGWPASSDRAVRVTGNHVEWSRGDSIVVRGSNDARIDHNVSAFGGDEWPCPLCGPIKPATANAAIWTAFSARTRIDHNEVYGQKWLGGDGEAFDIDYSAYDAVIENNYAHENEGGAVLFCGSINATARFNVFENNNKSTFAFIGNMPTSGTRIYNNSIYQSKATDAGTVRFFNGRGGKQIRFYNNLVYNFGRAYYIWPAPVWSRNNTFVGVHKSSEPRGRGWSRSEPKLRAPGTGGFGFATLHGYKPVDLRTLKQGVAIPKSVTKDFFGKKINPRHPPRGAAG